MRKRFIICFDGLTPAQSKLVTSDLKDKQLAWWHWIDDVWLVVDKKGEFSASEIRDSLKVIARQRMIVIELGTSRDTWAGVRTNDSEGKMFDWLKRVWKS